MGNLSNQIIIEQLLKVFIDKGFITIDFIFEMLNRADIPLDDLNRICDQLLSMGVIIRDDPSDSRTEEDDGEYDRSQTDYEQLYEEVVAIDPGLQFFIDEVRQIQPPQHREWQILIPQAKSGNQYANRRLQQMYLRTVVKLAFAVHKKYNTQLADTIQEGYIGLLIAFKKFEASNQEVFPSYFPLWVRQNILRYIPFSPNPLVYFSAQARNKLFSIQDLIQNHDCVQCLSSDVCPALINEVMGNFNCSNDEARRYLIYYTPFNSVDQLLIDDPEQFSDQGIFMEDYLEVYSLQELNISFKKLSVLKLRESEILQLRFGMIDGIERTLEEVGSLFGITRERTRQIESKAINKLKNICELKAYLDK